MEFIISRTSYIYKRNKQPCEEAKRNTITSTDGEFTEDCWMIELNTLEELIEFVNKYEEVVIMPYYLNESYKEIEIYDSRREC